MQLSNCESVYHSLLSFTDIWRAEFPYMMSSKSDRSAGQIRPSLGTESSPSKLQVMRNTVCAVKLLQRWLAQRTVPETRSIQDIPPSELDTYLTDFFTNVRRQGARGDYRPKTIANLRDGICRYLKQQNYQHLITSSPLFTSSRAAFRNRIRWPDTPPE